MYGTIHIVERLDFSTYLSILNDHSCGIVICATTEEEKYISKLESRGITVYTGVSGDKLHKALQLIRTNQEGGNI